MGERQSGAFEWQLEKAHILLDHGSIDLDKDIYISSGDFYGVKTALSYAASQNQLPFVRLFLDRGANPDISDEVII